MLTFVYGYPPERAYVDLFPDLLTPSGPSTYNACLHHLSHSFVSLARDLTTFYVFCISPTFLIVASP